MIYFALKKGLFFWGRFSQKNSHRNTMFLLNSRNSIFGILKIHKNINNTWQT